MEPSSAPVTTFDYILQIVAAVSVLAAGYFGTKKKRVPEPVATVSGALLDNRVVDPLARSLDRTEKALDRLCVLLEEELALRQSSAQEARRLEEQRRLAAAVRDELRDELRDEIREELQKGVVAKMPSVRAKPASDK